MSTEVPKPAESGNDRLLQRVAAGATVVGTLGTLAAFRYEPTAVYLVLMVVVLLFAFGTAFVPCVRGLAQARRRDLYVPFGVTLLSLTAAGAVLGAQLRPDKAAPPKPPCRPSAGFGSPKVGMVIGKDTDVYGRGDLCGTFYLWVVTRSVNGEYVSRTRDPISVNADGNWIDAQSAYFGEHPPPKFTYCLMATDQITTRDWQNRFKEIPQGDALDLTGLARPPQCLAEVTVRTK